MFSRYIPLLAMIAGLVSAQESRMMVHPLTDMPDAAVDVTTSYHFPTTGSTLMPIGQTVTVLCHFLNRGDFPYNVTAIMGSLNSPVDFSYHIQNYSYKPVGVVVRSQEEVTLEYQFQLHPDLQPMQYALAHTVFYEDDSISYSSTFFNQTVDLYFREEDLDFETVLQLLWSAIFSAGIIIALVVVCVPSMGAKRHLFIPGQKKSGIKVNDDWLAGSAADSKQD